MYKGSSKRLEHESTRFVRRGWGNDYTKKEESPLPKQKKEGVIRRRGNEETRIK